MSTCLQFPLLLVQLLDCLDYLPKIRLVHRQISVLARVNGSWIILQHLLGDDAGLVFTRRFHLELAHPYAAKEL